MAKEVGVSNDSGVFALISAVLSVIFPITAIPLGFVGGFVLGILALVFGIRQAIVKRNAWSTAAIIFAVLGLVLSSIILYLEVSAVNQMIAQYDQMQQSGLFNQAQDAANFAQQAGNYAQ